MGMVNNNVDESAKSDNQLSNAHEEKIFVSIRLRPLNDRELANEDAAVWECINSTTLLYKNSLPERSALPTAYNFDRVFAGGCSTMQVYEESAKRVALSVVGGINSSIFAYGQTSSGKTYTMCGITEYAIADIYDYIQKHPNRQFVLKFCAMEIYNEAVRDLLSSDATPLRLLDDPDRGTVIEKITEVALRDWSHLKELLSLCAAQRKIGETSLNEMSSRSHQILRLTVDSSAREFRRTENSSTLSATVNFVDLAGSERASQTLSAGTRLKEGSHINRSLLTLGTVIRKLSKGRNAHIPYRDSKLTRILQNSLGGNARTAIICTLSPAHSHVEQSRNTLLFASCAKQVSTNAHVNVVMSEKALVKQLQRELARLESQLKNLGSLSNSCDSLALKEKEILIEKMDKEIRELTDQRDEAHFRLHNLMQSAGESQGSRPWDALSSMSEPQEKGTWLDEYPASEASEIIDPFRLDVGSSISHFYDKGEGLSFNKSEEQFAEYSEEQFLSDDTSPRMFIEKYFGPDPTQGWEKIAERIDLNNEDNCKEVQCIEIDTSIRKINFDSVSSPEKENQGLENVDMRKINFDSLSSPENESQGLENVNMRMINFDSVSSPKKEDQGLENVNMRKINFDSVSSPEKENQGLVNVNIDHDNRTLKPTVDEVKEITISPIHSHPVEQYSSSSDSELNDSRSIESSRSRSCSEVLTTMPFSPRSKMEKEHETPSIEVEEGSIRSLEHNNLKFSESESVADGKDLCREQSEDGKFSELESVADGKDLHREHSEEYCESDSTDAKEESMKALGLADEVVKSKNQFVNEQVLDAEPTSNKFETDSNVVLGGVHDSQKSPSDWSIQFEKQRAEIIQLWDACDIPLVHRTYFFLVFKGDPSDSIYMEVELRRLSFLKASQQTNTVKNGQSSSTRALKREREMLSSLMLKKLSNTERMALFQTWGIGLKTKRRRLQLCQRLWTDTKDMDHIKESAALVAKLVGIVELSHVQKEFVGLSFSTPQVNVRSFSWKHSMPSLV
ncbi:kinesin-like protein KIN-7E [Coffea arabica]|uniref:Kinesin-like protein KIN-7E n=1 Tax=Coffea arabica TaxID=13443 RepID=A0ABM4VXN5_COFAR